MNLEWRSEKGTPTTTWVAELPWDKAIFNRAYYRVYKWKDGWAFSRPEHPTLGKLSGRMSTLEDAKQVCQEDFEKAHRLHLWGEYMSEVYPPNIGGWL